MRNALEKHTRQAIALLSPDAETKKLFTEELRWLQDRLSIWHKQEWRVALIGITSSGKSTLVNAMLDDEMLPVQVRPTSNSLVICRRHDEKRAVVYYEKKPTETVRCEAIGRRLKQLTDEKYNPNNNLGVKEIELFWPKFRLGNNVALVDTPGLDAYQLDQHEKVTMHFLLPSVDVVCFLTTAKSNSDDRIKNYLDIIGAHGKPLVILQNMIDSIEPKLGIGGKIERTKAEVAEDHLLRIRKLLSKLNFNAQRTPVLQISAQWALKGELGKSGINDLVKTVTNHLEQLEPRLYKGRYQQLLKELTKIVVTERSAANLTVSKREMEAERDFLDKKAAGITRHIDDFAKSLLIMIADNTQEASQLRSDAQHLSLKAVEEAKKVAQRIEDWFANGPAKLGNRIIQFQKETQRFARELNLTSEDLQFEPVRGPVATRVRVSVVEKSDSYKVEKKGFWNKFMRLIGFGGNKTITDRWEEIDIPVFKKSVEEHLEKEMDWLDRTTKSLKGHAETLCSPLKAELTRRRQSLDARISTQIAAERRVTIATDLAVVCTSLEKVIAGFPEEATVTSCQSANGFTEGEVELQLPPYVLDLVSLAHGVSSLRYHLLRNEVLQRISDRTASSLGQMLLWGFDGVSMDQFLSRFWSDAICGKCGLDRDMEVVDTDHGKIAVALHLADGNKDLIAQAKEFFREKTVCFLMLDVDQSGATMNHLQKCGLLPLLSMAAGIVLVVQGIRVLENSSRVAEGICVLKEIAREFELKVDGVLVNDEKDVTSVVVDRLFMRGDELRTIDDEQKWLADLACGDSKYVSDILRDWRDEIREEEADYA